MSEVAAPIVRSQSVSSPAAKVVTPTPVATPAPVVAAPPPVVDEAAAKLKRMEIAYNTQLRKNSEATRVWEAEKKTLAERAAKAAEYEKREQMARLDPPGYLKSLYGDDWHTMVNEAKLNGVPPGQLIQAEMQKLRDEFAAKEQARNDEAGKARESEKSQAVEQARRGIFAEAATFYREKAKDYPILAKLGGDAAVARTIANRIEAEFNKSVEFDGDGNVSKQGRILTTAEAADLLEAEVLEWVAEAGKHEKYKAKLTPAAAPTTVSASTKPQGSPKPQARRSITNDITGSTTATKPPATDRERRERAEAAFNEARAKRQG